MMNHSLLSRYLFLYACLCITVSANAQDNTKRVDPATAQTPSGIKPTYHRHRLYPNDSTGQANSNIKTPVVPDQLIDKSLNGQYQYLLRRTYNYQHPLISALWKSLMDTLNHERNQIKDIKAKLVVTNKIIDSLKTEANNIAEAESAKNDTMSMFGMVMAKSTFNLIIFGLVTGLGSALIIVALSVSKYKHDDKKHLELHEKLEEEFKTYKTKANERELKLARELQTERNKLDELLGRG